MAVFFDKALLEYIPKYGQKLADEVHKWGMWINVQMGKDLAEFYPKDPDGATPIAYLWTRTITCEGPGCGTEIPLIVSPWLAKKKGKSVAICLVPHTQEKHLDIKIIQDAKAHDVGIGTVRKGSAICPACNYTTTATSVRQQLKARRGGADQARLFAVVTTRPNQKGRFYRSPTHGDLMAVFKAQQELERQKRIYQGALSLVPDELTPQGGGSGAGRAFSQRGYGMERWGDVFTSRQKLALITLIRLVQEVERKLKSEHNVDFALAVVSILACAIDREAEHSSSLCRWNPTGQKIQATFGHQTLRMLWDFSETNLLGGSVGSWSNVLECVLSTFETALSLDWEGKVECISATKSLLPNDAAQAFVTDPPYYDAIPYADLSDYFYVWLKRSVRKWYPDLFIDELSPKNDECVVDEIKGHDKIYFENMMRIAMSEGCRILAPSGICIVVFAHKSTSGWEAQLQAMIDAGWTITGSWPIDTEMGTRLRARELAALASSIHLVCRPRKNVDGSLRTNDIGDWRDVLQELPTRIHDWMPRLAQEGVVGADAIFACLGPALDIFSRYSRVERADGEQVTLKEYLEYVWAAVSKEALHMIFRGADMSGFEADARITAMWLWTLSTGEIDKTNGNGQSHSKSATLDAEMIEVEEEEVNPKQIISAYTLEFDAARKIAQGLGANLDKLISLVEIKGSTARLRSVTERGRYLFDKNVSELQTTKPRRSNKVQQLAMFSVQELEAEFENGNDIPAFSIGNTMLDRLHQAMLLFAAGRSDALKRFLTEEGVGQDQRFWRLAQAFSSLYPPNSEERRWVEGVQGYKKGLGL